MSRTYERLKELEKRRVNPANGEAAPGAFEWGQVDRVQDLHGEAGRLRQTITTLETVMEESNKENVELAAQLEESRKRARVLDQEVAARDQKLKDINQTHEASVKELERKVEEKAKEIENLGTEYQQKVQKLEEQVVQRDGEVQSLQTGAEEFRQTIAALKAARETYGQENSELKEKLEELSDRLQAVSQEVGARDRRFEEVYQTHQALAEQLKTEIKQKSTQMTMLEERIENLKAEYEEKVKGLQTVDPLDRLSREERDRIAEKLLEGRLASTGPIPLKVTCPHCNERISRRFRLRLRSDDQTKTA